LRKHAVRDWRLPLRTATGVQGSNTGDEHLYYCQDANFNVTALVDGYDGAVVERYVYDPYGNVTVYNNWSATVAWADPAYSARGIVTAPQRMRACVGHAAPLS